jgi:CRISPR-associated protein Cas2
MRTTYLVCYDISDEKRLRRVAEICCDFGVRLQYSVFECDLNAGEKVQMEVKLTEVIDQEKDQVLFVNLGPAEGRGEWGIGALGRPYTKMAAPCYVF